MSSEGNVQFSSGLSLLNPLTPGGAIAGAPPNLLSGSFSLSHQQAPPTSTAPPQPPQTLLQHSVLKVSNLPPDLTQREAALIFSLVNDDVLNLDLSDHTITAYFKSLNTCVTTGKLLDGKYIFGSKYAPVKVDYDPTLGATAAFDNLRLSNPGISPLSSHLLLQQPRHSVPAQQQQQQPLSQPAPQLHPAPASGSASYDFQKRKSVGNQRSRFLFSDPFSGATTPTNAAPGSIDLSDLTGKSLLMMESQNDAREYENLVRDPWGSQSQGNMSFSNPQTPGLGAVPNNFEWGASGSASGQSTSSQPQHSQTSQGQQQGLTSAQGGSSDRRRTSSAFFNGPGAPQGQQTLPVGVQQTLAGPQSQPSQSQQQQQQQPPQTVAAILSQGPPLQSNGSLAPLSIPNRNGAPSAPSSSQPSGSSQTVSSGQPSATTPTSAARSATKDVPDLSLLARVPPPANPADQNPPCNTLYVGNLPPDATEAELRSLFSPQKGFRRLSFRTKNQSSSSTTGSSSHNHGPMCFVEFEDVAHATIALAELYGRALPRPNGSNGKGGIRLSFSKNPLGVRGPGNPRRTSTNQQTLTNGSSNNGGVGNYGYLSYH